MCQRTFKSNPLFQVNNSAKEKSFLGKLKFERGNKGQNVVVLTEALEVASESLKGCWKTRNPDERQMSCL